MKNSSFIAMVKEDIDRCDEVLKTREFNSASDLVSELYGKYSKVSANFPQIDTNPLLVRRFRETPFDNIRAIQGFLKAYLLNDCEDYQFEKSGPRLVAVSNTVTSTNNNENNNTLNNYTFQEARNKIEQMSALPDAEIEEILARITELESIMNSDDRKSRKWEKAKGILMWVADRGLDVVIALLPLFLKIS
jgi:hypothetical protein